MVLGQFPDICGPMFSKISENWPRTISLRATVPQLVNQYATNAVMHSFKIKDNMTVTMA
jgi:hypothetical protein